MIDRKPFPGNGKARGKMTKLREKRRQYKAALRAKQCRVAVLLLMLDVFTFVLGIIMIALGTYPALGIVMTVGQIALTSLLVKDRLSARKPKQSACPGENSEPRETKESDSTNNPKDEKEDPHTSSKMAGASEECLGELRQRFRAVHIGCSGTARRKKLKKRAVRVVKYFPQDEPKWLKHERYLKSANMQYMTFLCSGGSLKSKSAEKVTDAVPWKNEKELDSKSTSNGKTGRQHQIAFSRGVPACGAKVLLFIISFVRLLGIAEAQDLNTELTQGRLHENIWKPIGILVFCLCLSCMLRIAVSLLGARLLSRLAFLKYLYWVLPMLILLAKLSIFPVQLQECPMEQFNSMLPMLNPLFPSRVGLRAVTGTWLTCTTIPYNRRLVVLLPDVDELANMRPDEKVTRDNFFKFNMVFTVGVTLLLAMLAWRFGRRLASWCGSPVSELEASLLNAPRDKDEVLEPCVYHALFVSWYVIARLTIFAVVDACLHFGLLSDHFGLDWEAYLLLLQLLMLTQLVLSIAVFSSKGQRNHDMPVTSILMTCLPFLGTEVHIVVDNIVLALALRNSQCSSGGLAVVGYIITYMGAAYFFLHVPVYFRDAKIYTALRASHWGIAEAPPPSSAGSIIGNVIGMLITATTPDKESHAFWSELPMGIFKILAALFFGDSPFVLLTLVLAILKFSLIRTAREYMLPSMISSYGVSNNDLYKYYNSVGLSEHAGFTCFQLALKWEHWDLLATIMADAQRDGQALTLGKLAKDWESLITRVRREQTLGLVLNKIGNAGAKALAKALPNTAVQTLILGSNEIEDAGAKALAEALPNTAVRKLLLGSNKIGHAGAEALAKALPNTAVQDLNLGFNKIGDAGAEAIAKALPNTTVQELDLRSNYIGDAGAEALTKALPNTAVQTLHLGGNKIADAGAKALAKALPLLGGRSLDLRNNYIGDAGAKALAKALPNTSVQTLNLASNKIGDAGAKALAKALPNTAVQTLDLGFNKIGDAGSEDLAKALPNSAVHDLNLRSNKIGDAGTKALAKALPNTAEQKLLLIGNKIEDTAAEKSAKAPQAGLK